MTRLIRLAARLLYPPAWRNRYGAEFDALIDDVPGSAAALIDVVSGGLAMRMRMSHPAVMVLGLAAAGALVAGVTAFAVPAKFESRGTMRLLSADPGERWPAVFNEALARAFPAGEVAPANVSVIRTAGPDSSDEITVAYRSRDPHQARDVVQRLMGAAIEANLQQRKAGEDRRKSECRRPRAFRFARHGTSPHGSRRAGSSGFCSAEWLPIAAARSASTPSGDRTVSRKTGRL